MLKIIGAIVAVVGVLVASIGYAAIQRTPMHAHVFWGNVTDAGIILACVGVLIFAMHRMKGGA